MKRLLGGLLVGAVMVSGCASAPSGHTERAARPAPSSAASPSHPESPRSSSHRRAVGRHADSPTRHSARPHRGEDDASNRKTPGGAVDPRRAPAGTALAMLATLAVKGRAPMTGYSRDAFGQAWLDTDRNGCDTRSDLLGMYLRHVEHRPGTHGCVVASGMEVDPYTGRRVHYVRGGTYAQELDLDHVVALGNVWVTGGRRLPIRGRAAIANDPLNLLPVDPSANRQKGDGDAATWLPPNRAFRCAYVARQISVKHKYGLWVTPPEKVAMTRVLSTCPGQRPVLDRWREPVLAPVHVNVPDRSARSGSSAGSSSAGSSSAGSSSAGSSSSGSVYYANCTAVRDAGRAPLHRGQPGYAAHLDRDGDGVACE